MTHALFLFCNVGWMSGYEGNEGKKDKIVGGGKYVDENGRGGEVCNFLGCPDSYVYGFVETSKGELDRKIDIEKLGAGSKQDYVDGVTVVWTATDPKGRGRRVVGWYRNARVFKNRQNFVSLPSPQHKRDSLTTFNIRARNQDKVSVPVEDREHSCFHMESGSGWLGQTPWWFPHLKCDDYPEINKFIQRLSRIIFGDEHEMLDDEISEIPSETQKIRLLKARIGQDKFRASLEEEWESVCALTGCDAIELLRASHIKPWKDSDDGERLDKNNGLLLLASIDAAFDRGLISFKDSGEMLISPKLSVKTQRHLGIKKGMCLRVVPRKACRIYLKYHRDNRYQR